MPKELTKGSVPFVIYEDELERVGYILPHGPKPLMLDMNWFSKAPRACWLVDTGAEAAPKLLAFENMGEIVSHISRVGAG